MAVDRWVDGCINGMMFSCTSREQEGFWQAVRRGGVFQVHLDGLPDYYACLALGIHIPNLSAGKHY